MDTTSLTSFLIETYNHSIDEIEVIIMSGINSLHWHGKEVVERMDEVLKHRGSDVEETYADDYVPLGHRRLAASQRIAIV